MLLPKLLSKLLTETSHNPQLLRARKRHYELPTSECDRFEYLTQHDYQQARAIAQHRYSELAQMLRAVVKEHYVSAEQNKINSIIISLIDILASKTYIFPDTVCENIWYTDHYDLIELARNMGVGDESLPHWKEEANSYNRYLEITAADLIKILLEIAEEGLIEGRAVDADVYRWFSYIAREALKSRKRISRYRQKQSESLYVCTIVRD